MSKSQVEIIEGWKAHHPRRIVTQSRCLWRNTDSYQAFESINNLPVKVSRIANSNHRQVIQRRTTVSKSWAWTLKAKALQKRSYLSLRSFLRHLPCKGREQAWWMTGKSRTRERLCSTLSSEIRCYEAPWRRRTIWRACCSLRGRPMTLAPTITLSMPTLPLELLQLKANEPIAISMLIRVLKTTARSDRRIRWSTTMLAFLTCN